ncbi:MAG: oligosaccharide flippase family protein [Planctomycetota bacterium]|nr:oligosaccharide flippase family protein [Planctomycetota bacterium]
MNTDDDKSTPVADPANNCLATNIFYLLIAIVVSNFCMFLRNLIVIRSYGAAAHGGFVLVVSIAAVTIAVSDLGLASKVGVRLIARQRAIEPERLGQVISGLVTVQLLFAVVLVLGMMAFAGPLASAFDDISATAVRVAGAWVLLHAIIRICIMIYVGFERMGAIALFMPAAEAAKLVWLLICAATGKDVIWIFVGWIGAYGLAAILAVAYTRRIGRAFSFRVRIQPQAIRRSLHIIAEAVPYHVPFMAMFALPFVTQFCLGVWQVPEQVSFFQVCYSLAFVSRLVSIATATAIFPRLAHIDASAGADSNEATAMLKQVTRCVGMIATFVFAFYCTTGSVLLQWMYGAEYVSALPVLLVLAVGVGLENYTQQLHQVLMAMRKVRVISLLELLRYILLAALAAWAIRIHGAQGAAWTVCAAIIVNAVLVMCVSRRLVGDIAAGSFVRTLAVFAVVAVVAWLPYGRCFAVPAWLLAASSLGLFRLRQLRQWSALLTSAFRSRS